MKQKTRLILSLVMNSLLFVFVAFSVAMFFVKTGDGNMQVKGAECFKYFTIDSNVFCALTCIGIIVYDILMLSGKKESFGRTALLLKEMGATAVMLTFLVVVVFLGPTQGYDGMFSGTNFFLHLVCPLFAFFSYVFTEFEQGEKKLFIYALYALIVMVVYGTIYLLMVVVIKKWTDFYGLNRGGLWPISLVCMLAATYLISLALSFLNGRMGKNKQAE